MGHWESLGQFLALKAIKWRIFMLFPYVSRLDYTSLNKEYIYFEAEIHHGNCKLDTHINKDRFTTSLTSGTVTLAPLRKPHGTHWWYITKLCVHQAQGTKAILSRSGSATQSSLRGLCLQKHVHTGPDSHTRTHTASRAWQFVSTALSLPPTAPGQSRKDLDYGAFSSTASFNWLKLSSEEANCRTHFYLHPPSSSYFESNKLFL